MKNIKFEICCGSLLSFINAVEARADRVELCSALSLGGLTPSAGFIEKAMALGGIETNVLIRARQGDFCYTNEEVEEMLSDIKFCAKAGVNGVVVGALNREGGIDKEACKKMIQAAKERNLSVTFHRAIDRTKDIFKALEDVIELGADRVLTSGGATSALEGSSTLERMNRIASDKIIIMAGAGINENNVQQVIKRTGVSEVHFSASVKSDSPVLYREGISFTPESVGGDYTRSHSSAQVIKKVIAKALES